MGIVDRMLNRSSKAGAADVPVYVEEDDASGDEFWLSLMKVSLLFFTGYRAYHLITDSIEGEQKIAGVAALAGLDAGVLIWSKLAGRAWGTRWAITIAGVILDMIGVIVAVIGDSALALGINRALVNEASVYILPIVIVGNVALGVAYGLANPARKAREAERIRAAKKAREARDYQDELERTKHEIEIAQRESELSALRGQAAQIRQQSATGQTLNQDALLAALRALGYGMPAPSENGAAKKADRR